MADKAPRLSPAPIRANGNGSLERAYPSAAPVTKGDAVNEPPKSTRDMVDAWMIENPDKSANALDATAPETPSEAPTATPPAEPADVAPVVAPVEPPAPAAVEPAAPSSVAAPAEPVAPVAPATAAVAPAVAHAIAPTAKYEVAQGVEWTGEQVISALKERAEALPLAEEARGFQRLFGTNLPQVQQSWGPILARLAANPSMVSFLDGYLGNDEKKSYLDECSRYFDAQMGAAPATPATQAFAPSTPSAAKPDGASAMEREVAKMRAYHQRQVQASIQDRINREWDTAMSRYPFLREDQGAQKALLALATQINSEDTSRLVREAKARGEDPDENEIRLQAKGLLDAVEMQRGIYEARLIAAQASAPPALAAVAPAPVPALLGSPGASPNGARSSTGSPKSFNSPADAVADWLRDHPG